MSRGLKNENAYPLTLSSIAGVDPVANTNKFLKFDSTLGVIPVTDNKLDKVIGTNTNYLSKWDASNNLIKASLFEDANGNVGIGTSSPDPFSWGSAVGVNGASYSSYNLKVGDVGKAYVAAGSGAMYIGGPVPMLFYTGTAGNGTERMRIDSSGNVGLGVIPSAWVDGVSGTVGKTIQGTSWGIGAYQGFDGTDFATNAYNSAYGSAYKYRGTASATLYRQQSGSHVWFTAPSGTAGDSITFTPAMTLNTANKLLLGTTSPGAFDMVKFAGTDTVANDLTLYGPASSQVRLNFSRPGADGRCEIGYNMSTDILRFVTTGQQRITIDSSGDFFINKFAGGGDTSLRIDNNGRIYRGA